MGDIGADARLHVLKIDPCNQDLSCLDRLMVNGRRYSINKIAYPDIPSHLYKDLNSNIGIQDILLFNMNDENLSDCMDTLNALPEPIKSTLPIVALVNGCDHTTTGKLLDLGVDDFLYHPYSMQELAARLSKYTTGNKIMIDRVSRRLKEKIGLKHIVGSDSEFVAEINKIPQIARYDATVMITGETGTGKELVARAIHYLSPRYNKPMITFDCGAVPPELVENELFGHEKGAYTSASTSERGLIHAAEGGTLFLDEIDTLSTASQVKLLRLLQEKEYKPLGSNKLLKADIRFIAASNRDIKKAVREGRFRSDLFYRLNIIPIKLPPLKKRKDDIDLLCRYFLEKYSKKFHKYLEGFSDGAIRKLSLYDWPGNVRELENTIERAVVLSSGKLIQSDDITIEDFEILDITKSFNELKADLISNFETTYIKSLLVSHNGNISQAAKTAGKDRRAFWQLMKKHNITTSH